MEMWHFSGAFYKHSAADFYEVNFSPLNQTKIIKVVACTYLRDSDCSRIERRVFQVELYCQKFFPGSRFLLKSKPLVAPE